MDGESLSIGDAAAASGLSTKTIRYHEEIEPVPKAQRSNMDARTGSDRVYGECPCAGCQARRNDTGAAP